MNYYHFNTKWDYELLDSGEEQRLEKWGPYTLLRPDPQAIWQPHVKQMWAKAVAKFDTKWHLKSPIDQPWIIRFPLPLKPGETKTGEWDIKLHARLTPFKHTGIFAEQAANWEWLSQQVNGDRLKIKDKARLNASRGQGLKILNLFGYTGAATILLAKLGCFVTHVDASKPAIGWAKENQALNGLPEDSVRWILDDAVKFVKRELKRGAQYDGILMDPPAFGHSPSGKTWKFGDDFPLLLNDCVKLLSPEAQFLLINAYATNTSPLALQNTLEDALGQSPLQGTIESGELCLKQADGRLISTGIITRWHKQ